MAEDRISGILRQLTVLSPEELQKVCDQAQTLQKLKGGPPRSTSKDPLTDFDWLLEGILREIRDRGQGGTIPPDFRLRSGRSFGSYKGNAERMKEWLEKQFKEPPKRPELVALGIIVARALANYLESWSTPVAVDLNNLMRLVGAIPAALEHAYPMYIRSGLLPLLIKTHRMTLEEVPNE